MFFNDWRIKCYQTYTNSFRIHIKPDEFKELVQTQSVLLALSEVISCE